MIPKREAELKAAFTKELKRQLPGFMVLLLADAGMADRAIVGAGRTTYWEFKHATPSFASPGNQELNCMRLDAAGWCRYVIWSETSKGMFQQTRICTPKDVHERIDWSPPVQTRCIGYDMKWLVEQVKKAHGI